MPWQLGGGVIVDPVVLKDYEMQQAEASYKMLAKFAPLMVGVRLTIACVGFCSGNVQSSVLFTLAGPGLVTICALQLVKRCVQTSESSDLRVCAVIPTLVMLISNLLAQAVCATGTDDVGQRLAQDRQYFLFLGMLVLGTAIAGYMPEALFYSVKCPAVAVSWLTYHHRADQLNTSAVLACVAFVASLVVIRSAVNEMRKQHFLTARELEQTRRSLEQVVESQQSMLGVIFDASCVCDSSGYIKQATPQMSHLLSESGGTLVGTNVVALGATPEEKDRLQKFVESTWRVGEDTQEGSDEGRPALMQTCLQQKGAHGGSGASGSAATQGGDRIDAKIFCARLPGADVSAGAGAPVGPTSLWAHGGLFLGLQEVADSPAARTGAGGPSGTGGAAAGSGPWWSTERHEIVFDAGSQSHDILRCSRLLRCAGLCDGRRRGLLQLVPQHPTMPQRELAGLLDNWIVNEVQHSTLNRRDASEGVLDELVLDIPPSQGLRITAKKAWLQFSGLEHVDADIPAALRLQGVQVGPIRGPAPARGPARQHRTRPSTRLGPILEGGSAPGGVPAHEEEDENLADGRSVSWGTCTLLPDDAFSAAS